LITGYKAIAVTTVKKDSTYYLYIVRTITSKKFENSHASNSLIGSKIEPFE
jgi:hypothetical protein